MNRNIIALIVVIVATAVVIYGNFNINFNLFNSIISVLVFWLLYVLTLKNDELKHVKGEYKKQKEQLHDVLEYSSNWIAYKDLDGKITGCNDVVCNFFNLPRNEIIGHNMLEFFTKDEAEKINNYEKLVIEKKTTVDYNMEIKTNGDLEYFHVIKSPLLWYFIISNIYYRINYTIIITILQQYIVYNYRKSALYHKHNL